MREFMIVAYVAMFVAANVSVSVFGVWVTPINALVLIAGDMVVRDRIQHDCGARASILSCLLACIITAIAMPDSGMIAVASFTSAMVACVGSASVFRLRSGDFYSKSMPANIAAAAIDSVLFPLIAFDAIMPGVTLAQFAAKTIGSTVILLIMKRLSK